MDGMLFPTTPKIWTYKLPYGNAASICSAFMQRSYHTVTPLIGEDRPPRRPGWKDYYYSKGNIDG